MTDYYLPTMRYCRSGEYVITPRRRAMRFVIAALVVALLASAPWAWMRWQDQQITERLLIEKLAEQQRIEKLTIQYASGAKAEVNIRETK